MEILPLWHKLPGMLRKNYFSSQIIFILFIAVQISSCKSDEEIPAADEFRGDLISYELLHHYTIAQSDSVLAAYDPALLSYPNDYEIEIYKVIYKTIDANDNEVQASGAIVIPINSDIQFPLCLYDHGTVVMRDEVPSRESEEILIGISYACGGYVTALPDYLGMGDSPGLHPYCHAKTEASASVDILRATRNLC
jgi:hypothetical protein